MHLLWINLLKLTRILTLMWNKERKRGLILWWVKLKSEAGSPVMWMQPGSLLVKLSWKPVCSMQVLTKRMRSQTQTAKSVWLRRVALWKLQDVVKSSVIQDGLRLVWRSLLMLLPPWPGWISLTQWMDGPALLKLEKIRSGSTNQWIEELS